MNQLVFWLLLAVAVVIGLAIGLAIGITLRGAATTLTAIIDESDNNE